MGVEGVVVAVDERRSAVGAGSRIAASVGSSLALPALSSGLSFSSDCFGDRATGAEGVASNQRHIRIGSFSQGLFILAVYFRYLSDFIVLPQVTTQEAARTSSQRVSTRAKELMGYSWQKRRDRQ